MRGNEIIARRLAEHGIDVGFFIMGGPMIGLEAAAIEAGIRMVDVRHEQAGAMMAHAFARIARRPAVCMACSGPGATNLVTGVAAAHHDGAPLIVLAGAAPIRESGRGAFQEMDQVAMFAPITKWSERCPEARRLPQYIDEAVREAVGGRPGPVYLDLPGDVLYEDVPEDEIVWRPLPAARTKPVAQPADVDAAVALLRAAKRPVLISGSGVIWADADAELHQFVDASGVPFWTTPHGRGVVPEDHKLCFLAARSAAFRGADLIVQVGTRQNYVSEYLSPPRWSADAKLIQIDLDPGQIGRNRVPDVGIVGDAKVVLAQLTKALGAAGPGDYTEWVDHLQAQHRDKADRQEVAMSSDAEPIHPLRLCKEVRDFLPRDAVLVVDGQEILTYARQSVPYYAPHSLNSGPFGCMGVGLPYGLGAKVAKPGTPVAVLHGDGSFGLNAMEIDTALRHNIPVVCIISNNGGWTAGPRTTPGRDLGFTRYDLMFAPLGAHTEFVERPDEIRPALERAFAAGKPAVVNVVTDPNARSTQTQFTNYMT